MSYSNRREQIRQTVEIPLTQGKVAIIDAADLHIVKPYKWNTFVHHRTIYARTSIVLPSGMASTLLMHRLILGLGRNGKTELQTDHIDCDGLNNRRSNLRVCTNAENSRNRRLQENSSSGIAGVDLYSNLGKWRARIQTDGKRILLGYFDSKEDAKAVRTAAAAKYHGAFARFD